MIANADLLVCSPWVTSKTYSAKGKHFHQSGDISGHCTATIIHKHSFAHATIIQTLCTGQMVHELEGEKIIESQLKQAQIASQSYKCLYKAPTETKWSSYCVTSWQESDERRKAASLKWKKVRKQSNWLLLCPYLVFLYRSKSAVKQICSHLDALLQSLDTLTNIHASLGCEKVPPLFLKLFFCLTNFLNFINFYFIPNLLSVSFFDPSAFLLRSYSPFLRNV